MPARRPPEPSPELPEPRSGSAAKEWCSVRRPDQLCALLAHCVRERCRPECRSAHIQSECHAQKAPNSGLELHVLPERDARGLDHNTAHGHTAEGGAADAPHLQSRLVSVGGGAGTVTGLRHWLHPNRSSHGHHWAHLYQAEAVQGGSGYQHCPEAVQVSVCGATPQNPQNPLQTTIILVFVCYLQAQRLRQCRSSADRRSWPDNLWKPDARARAAFAGPVHRFSGGVLHAAADDRSGGHGCRCDARGRCLCQDEHWLGADSVALLPRGRFAARQQAGGSNRRLSSCLSGLLGGLLLAAEHHAHDPQLGAATSGDHSAEAWGVQSRAQPAAVTDAALAHHAPR